MSMTTQPLDYNNREYKSSAQRTPPEENDSSEELVDPIAWVVPLVGVPFPELAAV